MGRGQQDKATTAQALLYGRRARTLSPEAQKRASKARRAADKEMTKIAIAAGYKQAGEALAMGDGGPLQDLLDNPAGHGFKAVEYQQMRKLAPLTFDLARDVSDRKSSAQSLLSSDSLAALLDYQVRLSYARPSSDERQAIKMAISLYALDLAHKQIIDQLDKDRYHIGKLPTVIFGKDFSEHLLKGGAILCGEDRYNGSIGPSGSAVCSVLETEVDCQACIGRYENNPAAVDTMTPTTWLAHLRQNNLDNWATISLRHLNFLTGDSHEERASNLIESYRQESAEHIDSYTAPFTDYFVDN